MKRVAFAFFFLLLFPHPARADDAFTKLGRGLTNLITGWGEIPRQLDKSWEEKGFTEGTLIGVAKGLAWALVRTVTGAVETITFPIAGTPNYGPILEPEFVFSDIGDV